MDATSNISQDLKGWMDCAFCILTCSNLSTQYMLNKKLPSYKDTFCYKDTQMNSICVYHFGNFEIGNVADIIAKLCHHLPWSLKEVMRTFWKCVMGLVGMLDLKMIRIKLKIILIKI